MIPFLEVHLADFAPLSYPSAILLSPWISRLTIPPTLLAADLFHLHLCPFFFLVGVL